MDARPFVLGATILASAMAFIDGSVITIALPLLGQSLDAGLGQLQWILNAYTLFLGALILIGGAAGDRFGRRRVFLAGIAVFALASAACALAPTADALIAARALKGVGAALMVPQSLAIISASFPADVRGQAIGTWAAASALTTALGPALGGVLIDMLGWRSVFWINLPLAGIAVLLTLRYVPESRNPEAGPIDWIGGALAVLACGVLTMGLTGLSEPGGAGPLPVALIAAGVVGGWFFIVVERRSVAPLVPLGLFRSTAFSGANLMTLFLYGALTGMMFLLPFELIGQRQMSAVSVGLVMMPLGLIIGVMARPMGKLADRTGPRRLLVAGSLLVALAAGLLAWQPGPLWLAVLLPVGLLSAGMACVVSPLTTVVMNAAPDALAGAASGVNNAASRLAGLFAIALIGGLIALIAGPGFGAGGAGDTAAQAVFSRAFGAGMVLCAAAASLSAAVALRWIPAETAPE